MAAASSFECQLLAKVSAVPAGDKLPLSRIARELNCSTSVVISGVAALVMSGAIDEVTARAPLEKTGTSDPAAMSGPRLFDELCAEGTARGMPANVVSVEAFGNPTTIYNLRSAARPRHATVERARAWLSGKPWIAEAGAGAFPLAEERRETREARRQECETALAGRLPGETMAAAVKREAEQAGTRRTAARAQSGTGRASLASVDARSSETTRERFRRLAAEVESELADEDAIAREAVRERELDELVSPSSVLRRAQRDWPAQCEAVKRLAAELGVTLGEAWRRVIGAGVDCLSEADDEGAGGAIQRMAGA